MPYRIEIRRPAQRTIEHLPKDTRERVIEAVERLAQEPRPLGTEKVKNTDLWRIRVGSFRVIYVVDEEHRNVVVVRVARRSERTYRGLT